MGHIALGLEKIIAPGSQGIWMIRDKASWKDKITIADYPHVIDSEKPMVVQNSKIESGFLYTNDPASSQKFQSGLFVLKTVRDQ